MRSIVFSFVLVLGVALFWALQTPLMTRWNMRALGSRGVDIPASEEAILRLGYGAVGTLRSGLTWESPAARNEFAKLLMVLGESDGEVFLIKALHEHPEPEDARGRSAEMALLGAWDRRDGPDTLLRKRLQEVEHARERVPETMAALNDCLTRYPNWADGYARRGRLYQQGGEIYEARRDVLTALALAPNHFEALVTLGRVQLATDAPYHAYRCFERAILVNPRLKTSLRMDMQDAQKALNREQEKRREEKRKNAPLI